MRTAFAALPLLFASGCEPQPATGDEFALLRRKMVLEQLTASGREIKNPRVREVIGAVPRHEFVPASEQRFAYSDEPLPVGYGQTISQPFIVAFMTEQLDPKPTGRILEIGTGSGYQAQSSPASLRRFTRSRSLSLWPGEPKRI